MIEQNLHNTNKLTLRRNSHVKSWIYTFSLVIGIGFILFCRIQYPKLIGIPVLLSIPLLIVVALLLINFLPKVWLSIDNGKVFISEGVLKNKNVREYQLSSLKKVRFKTYKEASGGSSKMAGLNMGGLKNVTLHNMDNARTYSGGTYTVLLIFKNRKNQEFGFYLPKEKAIIIRQFIESHINSSV